MKHEEKEELVSRICEAQKVLRKELGDDWNDLLKTMYEPRVMAAMIKFSDQERGI
jgi:hypothetical protein